MATKRPLGLSDDSSTISAVRIITGPVVADPVPLTDANYPITQDTVSGGYIPVNDPAAGGVVNAGRWMSIFLGVANADGTPLADALSIVVEPLIFDRFGAVNAHWWRMLDAAGNPIQVTVSNAGFVQLPINGRTVFLRVVTVTGSISESISLMAFPGVGVLS